MFLTYPLNLDNPILLTTLLATFVCSLWIGWKLHYLWKLFNFWRYRKRGKSGEIKALNLLKKNGYKILESQLTLPGQFHVNEEPLDFEIRPDYLVEKDGSLYLAEIKTGNSGSLSHRETRRQLLEYACLSETYTIILVDATNETISRVTFYSIDSPQS